MIPTLLAIIFVVQLLLVSITANAGTRFSAYGYDDRLEEFFAEHEAPDNFLTQYVRYVYNLLIKRELSTGAASNELFMRNLRQRTFETLKLSLFGLIITACIGVPLGIVSATHRGRAWDRIISMFTMLLASIPSYVLTIVLVLVFALSLRLLPVFGIKEPGSYILPTTVLGIGGVSLMVRMTRSAVSDVLSRPYVTTLIAKGLPRRKIICGHVLKNSLVPIIATMNNIVVQMFCSTLVVENLFSIPGIGAMLVEAVLSRDLMTVLACVVVIAIVLMLIGLVSEILQLAVDPRARRMVRNTGKLNKKAVGGEK